MSARKKSRELLMQLVFQMSLISDFSEEQRDSFTSEYKEREGVTKLPDQKYFLRAFSDIISNMDAIDAAIAKASDNWKLDRMAKSDLAILRLAAAEIMFMPDIPDAVSINEAVELAKKYGGSMSYRYVNGVLGKIIRDLKDQDKNKN